MELNKRQTEILEIVKADGPITGEQIAERLTSGEGDNSSGFGHIDNGGLFGCKTACRLFLFRKETSPIGC